MDQLLAMRTFARVVEAGTFTKAADSLQMPKATVTKLVQSLEAHLGVRLLQRTTRHVAVTEDGALYYERATRFIKDLGDIDNSFGAAHGTPRGHLRVDTGSSVASRIIVPALPEFLERYPGIQLDLGVSDRHVDLISDNVDCVIRGGVITDLSLVARPIGKAAWITCATPDYLAAHGTPRHPSELEGEHRFINYLSARSGRPVPASFARAGQKLEIRPRHAIGINESNAHFAAALAGLGVIQTFDYIARDHIASGALVPILKSWQPAPYAFHVVYPPNRHLSNRVRVFIDWITGRFAELA
ncbi:LysR family transcriptional regulator [Duganella sp. HH101]|uniref:LysR substrate-binding domain-containing protein n=1 Tax=Duganella sp. HH101 TaxID=1781066 RepID=UPI0008754E68|nr:LysR family transcriptional regulator [Duganella sp. HH101]OFA03769.1 HTH-type transcriptional regulator DmlR [Duganella sp. HH101]OFA03832.1 HTH-type transcriptional regulator DmlR [Duganella sp. HH101]OFA07209.1 HTH-type transcriptional regulator DmlR [Duganella sp. HH101]